MPIVPIIMAAPFVLRLANQVLEEHVIPLRRLRKHNEGEAVVHKATLTVDGVDVLNMALTEKDFEELERSDGWRVIERGQQTFNMHGGQQ